MILLNISCLLHIFNLMKKLLLLLFCLITVGLSTLAEVKTITIAFNSSTLQNTTSKYVTEAWDFTVGSYTFNINQTNPNSGQIKANQNPGEGFTFFNRTAIPSLKSVKLVFKTVTNAGAKTPEKYYFNTGSSELTQQPSGSVGVWDATNLTATWSVTGDVSYFRFDSNKNTGGTIIVSKMIIEYEDGVTDTRNPVTLSWSAAEANATIGEDFTPPTISYSPDNLNIAGLIQYSSSTPAVADFDANGQLQIKAAGTTVISATIPADNTDYSSNTATYTLTVTEKPAPAVPGTWTLVESNSDIQVGARYIIVSEGNAISTKYKDNNRNVTAVTVNGKTVVNPSASVMTFKLEQIGTDYIWKAENYLTTDSAPFGDAYLFSVSSSNYLKCGTNYDKENQRNTTISIASSGGNATIKFVNCSNRVLRYNPNNGSPLFATYTGTTGSLPQLYKFVEEQKEPQDYKPAFPAELSMRVGDTYSLDLGEIHPDVKFTVEGNAVSVSDAGIITAANAGTATITASWDANDDWNAGTASIAVTVKEALKDSGLSFRHEDVVGKLGVGIAAQAVYHESDGEITYSSSDETVVKVNPRTGMITPADVLQVGTAVITASIAETEEYAAGTKSYNVRIEDPSVVPLVDDGPAMFDFRTEGCYDFKTNSLSGQETKYEKDFENPVTEIEEGGVILKFNPNGEYRSFNGTSDVRQLRIYGHADTKFSFCVPDGYAIAKIIFNVISSKDQCDIIEDVESGSQNLGTIDNGDADALDSETKSSRIWVANEGVVAQSVNFKTSVVKGHIRLRTISVVIKKSDSSRELPGLSFATRVYNTTENTDTYVNAATKTTDEEAEITYAIDNLTNDDYSVFVADDGQLVVNVAVPGVYTLRAKTAPTETLLPGVAILRLNVFPVLDVNATNINEEGALESGEVYKLLAPGGGMVNFGDVPSTLVIRYSANGGEETLHDGADIEVTEDVTYKYWMEYAETYNSAEQTLHVVVRPGVPVLNQETATYTFKTVDPTHTLYYIIDETGAKRTAAVDANLDGWTSANSSTYTYTLPEGMTDEQNVRVYTKAVKEHAAVGKVDSDTAGFILYGNGTTTAIDTIGADSNNSATEYFTLQGVRVARPANGNIYIVRRGTEVSKALVK